MDPADIDRVRSERDLFRRLLELGARGDEDVTPFLEDALALVVEVTGARKGYLELSPGDAQDAPRFWIAHGFADDEVAQVRARSRPGSSPRR